MRLGVDFAAQDLLRAGDGERGHAIAQLLAGAGQSLIDLGLRRGLFPRPLVLGGAARLVDELRAAASRKRLHMMPTPMHAPAAPRPTIRPMPIPV